MKIPRSSRKRALVVVDVQPSFLNDRNAHIVPNIVNLLRTVPYDCYIEATFHAEQGSLWDIQQGWTCPKGIGTNTVDVLASELRNLHAHRVEKQTKSVFKGNPDITKLLREKEIEEVHVAGVDTNDCVLATAYEAFDLGFVTYVIEECCQSSSSDALHASALELLRHQNMTNNSCAES